MSFCQAGFDYEQSVVDTLIAEGVAGNISGSAGSSNVDADADFKLGGRLYNVEVKLNRTAQMGGSSVSFKGGIFSLVGDIDSNTETLLLGAMESKRKEIKKFLRFVSREKGVANKLPMTCSKEIWTEAQKKGLLVNTQIPLSTDFICEHYAKKNVSYIQIGGSGLFFLKDNPANLPVPKLEGSINVEIRTGRSGSKKRADGSKYVAGGLRVQARLKTKCVSDYSLDNASHIQRLFS